jgi:hypothetical protein
VRGEPRHGDRAESKAGQQASLKVVFRCLKAKVGGSAPPLATHHFWPAETRLAEPWYADCSKRTALVELSRIVRAITRTISERDHRSVTSLFCAFRFCPCDRADELYAE